MATQLQSGYRPESVYLERTFTSLVKHAFRRTRARSPIGPLFIGAFGERALPFFPPLEKGDEGGFDGFSKG